MKQMNTDVSVVVLRSGHHGGLGIVRSLGRLGVPVYCVDADRWESGFSSRYCRGRSILNVASCPPSEAVAGLLKIAKTIRGRPILMPTTDEGIIWISENAAALRERYVFPSQPPSLIRTLADKGRMKLMAQRFGIPTAQSMIPTSMQDVEQFVETAEFPIMVKATDDRLRHVAGGTKFLIHSPRELLALYARAGDAQQPNLLLQEFIPGEDWMFDGYFDANSECLFGATGKKIRRFPADTGITSLGVCIHNDAVYRMTLRFMKAIGYRGILDIGYRYDQREKTYKVLDVNPRIGCTFRLFAATEGLDVARALYLHMTGQAVPPSRVDEGRKWMVEDLDLLSAFRSMRDRRLRVGDWLKSLRGIHEAACFAWDDPLPFLMMGVTDCCEFYQWMRRKQSLRRSSAKQGATLLQAIGRSGSR